MSSMTRCVVGVDGSEESANAFAWTVAQADSTRAGEIVAVHAILPAAELLAAAAQVNLDPLRAERHRLLNADWINAADARPVRVTTELVDDGPAMALVRSSERHNGATIVLGHRRCVGQHKQVHVGHVVGQVLHRSSGAAVIVAHDTAPTAVAGPLLVAVHGTAAADDPPIAWAVEVAEERGLRLLLVPMTTSARPFAAQLQRTLALTHPTLAVTSEVSHGQSVEVLAGLAEHTSAGMVVVGNHRPNASMGFLADGLARRLPMLVACPVVAVPVY